MKKVCAWFAIFAALISILKSVKCEVRSVYVIPEVKANWTKAVEHCDSIGMQLAVLDRKEFNDELKVALMDSHAYKDGKGVVWVGGNDEAEEGKFHWRPTGEPVVYTNWAEHIPDNTNEEDCMEFGKISYGHIILEWQWNDNNCAVNQYFACQLVTV